MTARAALIEEEVAVCEDLHDLVSKAFEECEGDISKTCILAKERLVENPELRRKIMEPIEDYAIKQEAEIILRRSRSPYWRFGEEKEPDKLTKAGLIAQAKRNWMEYPTKGGKPLGDRTKVELDELGDWHAKSGKENMRRGRFYKLVAANLKGDKDTPRKRLTNARLTELALAAGEA